MFNGSELASFVATRMAIVIGVVAVGFYAAMRSAEWVVSHLSFTWN